MNYRLSIVGVLVTIVVLTNQITYDRVLLSDPEALCLDGSPGIHYLQKGDLDRILLFFYGGGWCGEPTLAGTLESCYQRSKTPLGSSKAYGPTLDVNSGIGSGNDDNYFKNWTKVMLVYCDGSGHQGYKKDPVEYKGSKLYFRGEKIVKGHFASLEKSVGLLTKAKQIVVSGASAGGLATYLWTNYIKDNTKAQKVWSIPDSGIFLNQKDTKGIATYELEFINLMKLSNVEVPPPPAQCVAKHKNQLHKCMFAQNIYQNIKVPLFNIISLYDSWSIPNILGINCVGDGKLSSCSKQQLATVEDYHQKTKNILFLMSAKPNGGAWAPVCINHCYVQGGGYNSPNYRIPSGSVYSPNETIKRWMEGTQDEYGYKHIDKGEWPDNKPCSGTNLSTLPQSEQQQQMYLPRHAIKIFKGILKSS